MPYSAYVSRLLAASPEFLVEAEIARACKDQCQEPSHVDDDEFSMLRSKCKMMDKVKGDAKICNDDEGGHARSQPYSDEQRADRVGNERDDQTCVRSYVDWIGEASRHVRKMRYFFDAVFQEKTGPKTNAQDQQTKISRAGSRAHRFFHSVIFDVAARDVNQIRGTGLSQDNNRTFPRSNLACQSCASCPKPLIRPARASML